jgi:hypothetical protein
VGSGPLLAIGLLADLGLTKDPNPVGFGHHGFLHLLPKPWSYVGWLGDLNKAMEILGASPVLRRAPSMLEPHT